MVDLFAFEDAIRVDHLFLGQFECFRWEDRLHGVLGGWRGGEQLLPGGDTVLRRRLVGREVLVFRQGSGGGLGPLNIPHFERAKYGFLVDVDMGEGQRLQLRVLRLWYRYYYDVRVRLRGGEDVFVENVPGHLVGAGGPVTFGQPQWMCEPAV